jgi:hypothetical protein
VSKKKKGRESEKELVEEDKRIAVLAVISKNE